MKNYEFERGLSEILRKKGEAPQRHISQYGEDTPKRIFVMPRRLRYKEGDRLLATAVLFAGAQIASCDYFTYTVTSDWGYEETRQISGAEGTFDLCVDCAGLGELSVHVIACNAQGNPIEGVAEFDDSIVVEPDTFKGLWAEELAGYSPISVNGREYKMTFFDDFNGSDLDTKKWSLCPEQCRQDAGGYWRDSMTSLDGSGNLVLSAAIDEKGTPISGAVRSLGKFEQARGYFEVRCKLQSAPGLWGAFWLMCREMGFPGDGDAIGGAELDIFESNSVPGGDINHAIHWGGYGAHHRSVSFSREGTRCYDGEYHTFALLWDEEGYIFYIDGKESWRSTLDSPDFPGSCIVPCYLKLSVEFGSWAGRIDPRTLPDKILVDYVKVYERL